MTRMVLPALVLGLGSGFAGASLGNREASSGTAIVNINAVLSQVPEYVKSDSILAREKLTFDREVMTFQDQIQAASAAFDQSSLSMTQVAREAERVKLQARYDSLQKVLMAKQTQLQSRRDELLGPTEDRLTSILEGLRAEGNYSVVLNVSSEAGMIVVAADKAVDLTAKAIERIKAGTPEKKDNP